MSLENGPEDLLRMSTPRQTTTTSAEGVPPAPPRRGWHGYAVAVAAVFVASLLMFGLRGLLGAEQARTPFIFFFPAVLVAALYGGRGPGWFSIALSALAADYFFIPPFNSFTLDSDGLLQLAVFVTVALLINHLTERSRRAEVAARKSEESLATTLRSIGDAVIATDTAGRVTFMNPVAQALTGWTSDEAAGRPLAEVFRIVNEETRAEVESPAAKVLREGRVVGLANHTVLLARDGAEVPIADSGAPIRDPGGNVSGVVLVFHDVSERRRAEEERVGLVAQVAGERLRLNHIVANVPGVVWESWGEPDAASQRINFVSDYVEGMLGYSVDEWLATPNFWLQIVHPEDREGAAAVARAHFESGEGGTNRFRWVAKDGRVVPVETQATVIRDERGRPAGMRGVTLDITERRRTEEERERLLAREQEARAEAERAAGRTARLQAITAALSEALTPAQVASTIVGQGLGSLGAHAGAIVILADGGAELELVGAVGFPTHVAEKWQRFTVGTPVPLAEAVREGHPVLLESLAEWERRFPVRGPLRDVDGVRALAAVPLIIEGRTLGAIGLGFRQERPFGDEDCAFMLALARQCAQALERARLYEAERRSRAEVESSEQRYRYLADSMPQIVWTARPDGYIDYYNKRWFDYTGMLPEQAAGWGWQHVTHPDDVEHYVRRWATSVQTGRDFSFEFRLRRASDGGYRWHLGRGEAMHDAAGQVARWFGTATDIHDQKQAEEALRFLADGGAALASSLDYETTLGRLARLAVSSLADFCVIDLVEADGQVRRVAAAHADPGREELARALRRFPPDPQADVGVSKVLRSGRSELFRHVDEGFIDRLARGEHRELLRRLGPKSFMTVPLLAHERVVGALTFALTDTGRQHTPADLALAEELARRAALAIDNSRLFGEAREAARRERLFADQLRGLTRAAVQISAARTLDETLRAATEQAREIIGAHQAITRLRLDRDWAQAVASVSLSDKYADWRGYGEPIDGSGIYALVCRSNTSVRMTQEELESHPSWPGPAAGRHPPMRGWLAAPLVASGGQNIGLIQLSDKYAGEFSEADEAVIVQLARTASVAFENVRLYQLAQQANQAKDEFLATLSHELRTPLTPIIGWVHMILSGRITEADARLGLGVIDKNSQALARLINDLLDMSSIMSGKMRIERAPVGVDDVLREAVETVRPLAERRGIRLEAAPPCDGDGSPLVVSGDRTRLVQVFWNLLDNAVKFSDEGGRVSVGCRAEGGAVRVTVEDAGAGIDSDFLPHVFERFRQADGSTTRPHGGLGIGLALVKSFAEAHGGAVTVESAGAGLGSSFTVTLPLLGAPGAAGAAAAAGPEENGPGAAGARRVLIVEDARDTLDMLQVVFAGRGYQTTLCETAEEALRAARDVWFDIVVSDIGLPHIDGYELIQRLRRIPHMRDVPAVALTGYAAPKDAEAALAAGYDVHIAKPVDPAALAREVEQLLRRKGGL